MTVTRGGVVIEDIKIGDIHYEAEFGVALKVEVITLPKKNEKGQWVWKSKIVNKEEEVDYLVTPGLVHYGPNLYPAKDFKGRR